MNEPQKNEASPKKSAKKKSAAAGATSKTSTSTITGAADAADGADAAHKAGKQEALELAKACAQVAHEKLGEEIAILDVSEILRIADYFVVVSGRNERHVRSIAAELDMKMKARGVKKARIEGGEDGRWALLDFSDVIVHVLEQEARSYYGLERLWADAPRVEWTPEQRSQVAS
jgi:ribosome-associated protein